MTDIDQVALEAARQLTADKDPQGRAAMQCAIIAAIRRAMQVRPEAVRLRDELRGEVGNSVSGKWSEAHAKALHESVHAALSVHITSASVKKREAISAHVKRLMIDSLQQAALASAHLFPPGQGDAILRAAVSPPRKFDPVAAEEQLSALAARQPVGQELRCSGGFVIGNGSGDKYMAWGRVGPEWVADRSAALWLVRRADAEALAAENEDAWLILPVERCALPPEGWACTLASGHEGPCPTIASPLAQTLDPGQIATLIRHARVYLQGGLNSQCLNKLDDLQALIAGQSAQEAQSNG